MNKIHPKNFSWLSFGILCAGSLFVFLCCAHFLRGRPLWLDEQSVFKSLETYQTIDFFTKKLQVDQIFPRVYLAFIQKIGSFFSLSVWGVRLLPFLSMLLAFFVWFSVARRELKGHIQLLTFCLCWTASIPLIYYAAELKQYSMDVLSAGLFTLFLLCQHEWASDRARQGRYLAALALLPFLGFFSYPAFLFFIFLLWNIWQDRLRSRKIGAPLAVFVCASLFALGCLYFFDLRITRANAATQGYQDYSVSLESLSEFFKTAGEGTINLFSRWFVEQPRIWKKVSLLFTVFGLVYIPVAFFRGKKLARKTFTSVDQIALVLFVELFLLGVLKKYPFSVPRTSLFYSPIVFLMTIKAMAEIRAWQPWIGQILQGIFILFLVFLSAGITGVVLTQPLGAIHPVW